MSAPGLLVDAALSYLPNGEDRLTELLAVALHAHPPFLSAFAERIGLPAAENYSLVTQHWADTETRVDMRIEAHTGPATLGVAYVENKLEGYWFSATQVRREKSCLQREYARARRFVCIVPAADLQRLTSGVDQDAVATAEDFDEAFTWVDVADLASSSGAAAPAPWGGATWRESALTPDAPAAQRVLREFIAYLAEDEMPDQISMEDVRAFNVADEVLDVVANFLEDGAFSSEPWAPLSAIKRGRRVVYNDKALGRALRCVDFDPEEGHWLADTDDAALTVAIDPGADPKAGDEGPLVHIGLYLNKQLAPRAKADVGWLRAAASLEFTPIDYPAGLWLCRTVLLKHFASSANGYDSQVDDFGRWIKEALDAIATLRAPADDEDA